MRQTFSFYNYYYPSYRFSKINLGVYKVWFVVSDVT